MSRRVHLPALVSLLALVACGTRHARIDIDTDGGPDAPGTETPVTETPVAGTTGDATPDGGEGLTVDPTTGEPVATDADPTGTLPSGIGTAEADARKAGKAGRRFRWDETAADLDLESELRGGKVATSTTGPWTSRTSGGGFGPAGGFGRRGRSGARMAELGAGPADFSGGGLAVHEEGMVASRKSAVVAPTPRRGTADGAPPPGMPTRPMPVAQSALKAGSTDDNADLDAYRAFVEEWTAPGRLRAAVDTLDISDARTLVVTDPVGRPVPGAQVSVTDLATDTLVWTGTTYGDGTAPWYPHLRAGLLGEPDVDGSMGYAVQAHHDGVFTTQMVGARDDVVRLTLDESATGPTKVDVVFLIDTTGSMGDEIHRIKSTLLSTTAKVRGLDRDVDLQYGAVLYRDLGDEYVTRAHPLTGDIQGFDGALQGIQANGGGDGPESLNQGLAVAVDTMDWREDSAKLVFVVADAPPHMDYQGDVTYGRSALAALHKGIRIHTVAASGLDDHGSLVFRQTAQLSQGKFIFIEYGSTAASAADHGVRGQVASNNLDDILYREIEAEVTGWGEGGGVAHRSRL